MNKLIDLMVGRSRRSVREQGFAAAAYLFIISTIGWRLTAFTILRHEQQGILGLSWGAVILESVVPIVTTDIREEGD